MELPWNNQEKEQPVEQPAAPEPEKKKRPLFISQSLIKKVIDKNGVPQDIILRDQDRWLIKEYENKSNINK